MTGRQHLQRQRRKVEARVAQLEIPTPFDVEVLCQRLGQRRGKEIRLRAESMAAGPYGLWADVGDVDYIVYERSTTPIHQEQIILHEVGHLLADHAPAQVSDGESTALLLPDLDLEMVRRVMGRHGYTSEEEQEAELLATIVLERAGRTRTRAPQANEPGLTRALDRLGAVLARRDQE